MEREPGTSDRVWFARRRAMAKAIRCDDARPPGPSHAAPLRDEWELCGWEDVGPHEGLEGYYRPRTVLYLRPGDLEAHAGELRPVEAVMAPWGLVGRLVGRGRVAP